MLPTRNSLRLALLPIALLASAPPADAAGVACSDHVFEVTLAPGETETFEVVGTLCSRRPEAGRTVQVLLHGATYDGTYWDFPHQPQHYSYVRAAAGRGYATFNLDRIGNGRSDHPAGERVDIESNAFVVHQVIAALRAGEVGGAAFDKVMVVGHSMGSFVALVHAATFPADVDGLVLTGFLHDVNFDFVDEVLLPSIYPARLDPKFAGRFSGDDYLTSVPGSRGETFYYAPTADPAVIELDEALKETATVAEFGTGPAVVFDPISFDVEGPVLVILGEFDFIFCGNQVDCSDRAAVESYERGFYGAAACVDVEVVGASGHVLNLQRNAHSAYARMLGWADRRVGRGPGPAPDPCVP